MGRLIHKKRNHIIASYVKTAKSIKERFIGLIGQKNLREGEVLFIPSCPSVHTFFMKFPIDVIFTDQKFKVVSLFENVPSGKILFGGLKSHNVFEMKGGQIQSHKLKKGDVLYVEP